MVVEARSCPFCRAEVPIAEATCAHCRVNLATGLRFARERPRRGMPRWIIALISCAAGLLLLGCLVAFAVALLNHTKAEPNSRNASGSLKTIATAQSDFRSNDRDNNGVNDYWTGDIAGLHRIDNSSCSPAQAAHIKLIEVSVAAADLWGGTPKGCTVRGIDNYNRPITAEFPLLAKAGYWYMTLYEDRSAPPEGRVYRQNTGGAEEANHNLSRFGAAAMPESYGRSGRQVFLINERNTLFKRDFDGDVLSTAVSPPILNGTFDGNWPSDEERYKRWKLMD